MMTIFFPIRSIPSAEDTCLAFAIGAAATAIALATNNRLFTAPPRPIRTARYHEKTNIRVEFITLLSPAGGILSAPGHHIGERNSVRREVGQLRHMNVQRVNHFIAGTLPVERQIEVCSRQHDRLRQPSAVRVPTATPNMSPDFRLASNRSQLAVDQSRRYYLYPANQVGDMAR